jgi:hypothetical protein
MQQIVLRSRNLSESEVLEKFERDISHFDPRTEANFLYNQVIILKILFSISNF